MEFFSFWGNLGFVLALATFFLFTTFDFLPDFDYVLYIPLTGYFFEALLFFFSLVVRQKIIDRVGHEQIVRTANKARASEKDRYRMSNYCEKKLYAQWKKKNSFGTT